MLPPTAGAEVPVSFQQTSRRPAFLCCRWRQTLRARPDQHTQPAKQDQNVGVSVPTPDDAEDDGAATSPVAPTAAPPGPPLSLDGNPLELQVRRSMSLCHEGPNAMGAQLFQVLEERGEEQRCEDDWLEEHHSPPTASAIVSSSSPPLAAGHDQALAGAPSACAAAAAAEAPAQQALPAQTLPRGESCRARCWLRVACWPFGLCRGALSRSRRRREAPAAGRAGLARPSAGAAATPDGGATSSRRLSEATQFL